MRNYYSVASAVLCALETNCEFAKSHVFEVWPPCHCFFVIETVCIQIYYTTLPWFGGLVTVFEGFLIERPRLTAQVQVNEFEILCGVQLFAEKNFQLAS